ncbi:MAG: methylenetetrahydrofolate reductase [Acidimicrobiales bacterium]
MSRLSAVEPLLRHPRYEVIPSDAIEDAVVSSVPRDVTLTVTASPTKGLEATIALAQRLSEHGFTVVPHLSARLVVDDQHLEDVVAQLRASAIDDVFVPAGDADPPAGRFDSALSLLIRLDEMGRPFSRMGITGYPQSHPNIDDDVTVQAMWDKRHYATYIVSNLCFDPSVVRRWVKRVRARGVTLPIYFGLAGPVERTKLLTMATKIGVGESARFLSGHAEWFLRMGAPGGYNPSRLLARTSATLRDPASDVEGLHVFTFNQVRQTEQWRQGLLATLA